MAEAVQAQQPVTVELTPHSDRFSQDHPSWATQTTTLWEALEDAGGSIRHKVVRTPGTKGGAETIVLALGSAGAVTAMVEVIKAWLGRDRSRYLEISTVDEVHGRRAITVRGEQVDTATLRAALHALAGPGDG